jgi:hypothetical protein
MGKVYPELDERLRKFIAGQPVFFVATAPCLTAGPGTRTDDGDRNGAGHTDRDGTGTHINVSPKGYRDTFAILGPRTVAYLDLTGSGAETIAHLRQNGKITIMFCSFDHTPKILRLYGTGRVVRPADAEFAGLAGHFPAAQPGASGDAAGHGAVLGASSASHRAIIVVAIDRIADSCGYAVPVMELAQERELLDRWTSKKSAEELAAYRVEKNSVSIDGLPALDPR